MGSVVALLSVRMLPIHRRDCVFVVRVKVLLLELEQRSAYELLPRFVRLFLLEQSRSDLLADALAGRVSVCYDVFGIELLGRFEVSAEGFGDRYVVVE